MTSTTHASTLDRAAILDRFRAIRNRTRQLFSILDDSLYYTRPIALRNPVVFYEGHLPAFAVNTLVKRGLGWKGVDPHLEDVFARGIDPETEATAVARGNPAWPARNVVQAYADAADALIAEAIVRGDLARDGHPLLEGAQALWTILEHEEMHQETLAYMWHQVPHSLKRRPEGYVTLPPSHVAARVPAAAAVPVPRGLATLGTRVEDAPFAWDNERPAHTVAVDAFTLDAHNVSNGAYLEFVEAGGYRDPQWWRAEDWEWVRQQGISHPPFWERDDAADAWWQRAMFERVPLPAAWPVYVTWAEAHAFARWRGRRLPSEAEFQRAACGTQDGGERPFPWGHTPPERAPGNFDFRRWDPEPVGLHPEAASAFGIHDLVGNGWEWTSTVFAPFSGFQPIASYPEYSADFFDAAHFVMKGASPVTVAPLIRSGFRNWFRPRYPYVYGSFRLAGDA